MKISKFGHACLLIEEGQARILIDPGVWSRGFEGLRDLDAVLITHQHQDHLDVGRFEALLEANPEAKVYVDEDSAAVLAKEGTQATVVRGGDRFEVVGVSVEGMGKLHAVIHSSMPDLTDMGYLIANKFFYPGDAWTEPGRSVEVLAMPVGAPWMKIGEGIDYIKAVRPRVAIPVHDAVLSEFGMEIHVGALTRAGQSVGSEVRVVEDGGGTEV